MEKNKKIVSISLDREVLDRLNTAHIESGEKSRSRFVEAIIDRALIESGEKSCSRFVEAIIDRALIEEGEKDDGKEEVTNVSGT